VTSGFGLANLPYGVFSRSGRAPAIGVAIGDDVLEVAPVARTHGLACAEALGAPTLNAFLALGPPAWSELRAALTSWLTEEELRVTVEPHLHPLRDVRLHLPFAVADYVDFYSSEHHALNISRILRPESPSLAPAWKHLPIGYHGRAGTVVVSGTDVARPNGQRRDADAVVFGPSHRLDIEAEVGFVVGVPSSLGRPVALSEWREHVFGVCLLNDWSARDIQAFETIPLGPFLGKSFLTSVSPWIVPLAALEAAWTDPPPRDPPVAAYLDDTGRRDALALSLEVRVNGEVVSRPPFTAMYWTAAQQLAHLTVNGASLRTGDLYASGTVSGPRPDQVGSLMELGTGFLRDGDTVTISATAPAVDGTTLSLGEVTGTVVG
jgi:fumarylacetoacetase